MRIGIDLGGSKIDVIALGGDDATLHRVPSPADDFVATVTAAGDLVRFDRGGADCEGRAGASLAGSDVDPDRPAE